MTTSSARLRRLLFAAIACVLLVMFSTSVSAQEAPSRVKQAAKAAMNLAETSFAPAALERLQGALLLRRTTGAVFAALDRGLVLMDIDGRRADSKLYVKFDRDAMPQLRWKTRF